MQWVTRKLKLQLYAVLLRSVDRSDDNSSAADTAVTIRSACKKNDVTNVMIVNLMEEFMLRRQFLVGSVTICCIARATPTLAQGVCKSDGPTADDIFKDLAEVAAGNKGKHKIFNIEIKRGEVVAFSGKDSAGKDKVEDGVVGKIILNGKEIGQTVENDKLKIPVGEYPGYLRYVSSKNFVQGPLGELGKVGDFLLEVGSTAPRTNILFHGGTKPWHSEGCILLGAVKSETDRSGKKTVTVQEGSALAVLRRAFYETDKPAACPNKSIRIKIS